MPRTSGGKRKKTRTHNKGEDPNAIAEEEESVPKSFIIKRGKIGMYLKDLLTDLRELMYPYTATRLVESKKNSIKDYISAAGMFGVSHMMILT